MEERMMSGSADAQANCIYCLQTNQRLKTGLTVVEVLVILLIVSLAVAISLPAISTARDMSRRWLCQNKLRQIGIGLAAYHDSIQTFPFGWQCDSSDVFCRGSARDHMWSGWSQLVAQLGAGPVFNSINFDLPVDYKANRTCIGSGLDLFVCPSSENATVKVDRQIQRGQLDYAMNSGTSKDPKAGIMFRNSNISTAAVSDGLSHTIDVGELSNLVEVENATRPWAFGSSACSLTNNSHKGFPLNSVNSKTTGWSSAHKRGKHFLLCDGAVRFFTHETPGAIIAALSTRDLDDPID